MKSPSIIVTGGLNVDLIATGINNFPKSGEHVYGQELRFGPGGKSRNIANMIAVLTGKNVVAMIGKTVRDPYNLWRIPMKPLEEAGVNTKFIQILDYKKTRKLPGVALIPIDKNGNNIIYVLPGINADFSIHDIDLAEGLFKRAADNRGMFVTSLEIPFKTAVYAFEKANTHKLKIILDPGGMQKGENIDLLLQKNVYVLKPNEHEAEMLTGVAVSDFNSAKKAAQKLLKKGVKNVFITHGKKGAYLFGSSLEKHIKIPSVKIGRHSDETGCGDQTLAALCTFLWEGKSLEEAADLAILAGTLQFQKLGIQPVRKAEILKLYERQGKNKLYK